MTRKLVGIALSALFLLATTTGATAQPKGATPSATLTIDFLDVGQGDSALIRSPEGKTALIDAGPSMDVAELLAARGVTRLDLLALSHHHQDHYGGAVEVIRKFKPRVFLASKSAHTTRNYLRLLEVVRDAGITAIAPTDRPRKIELGSVVLTVFPQPPEDPAEENNNSVGIRLDHGSFSALFPGDAEEPERTWWESNHPDLLRDVSVLKVAHHGSRNGTDSRWLSVAQPKLAVASLGRGNPYGHPHPETLALLTSRRVPLLRTDQDGSVRIASSGRSWEVVRSTDEPRGPPAEAEARGSKPVPAKDRPGLNTASQVELETLPGIGPVLARRIIEGRPYRTVEDLRKIRGIGPKRFERIRALVRVE